MRTELQSINPATEELIAVVPTHSRIDVGRIVDTVHGERGAWRGTAVFERARLVAALGARLRDGEDDLAGLITREMGKPLTEARAEVLKCARLCDHYAEHAEAYLRERELEDDPGARSWVRQAPLGTVLGVMPWNYPLWQLIRFAVPALIGGNTVLLKHASNVPQCSLAFERAVHEAGFPPASYRALMIGHEELGELIDDARVAAVSLTGSERAGARVGGAAGAALKPAVMELGGSDPFIVLADADLEAAIETGVKARFQNTGQSCIAAKRFLVVAEVFDRFVDGFVRRTKALPLGDPMLEQTRLGPLARSDIRRDTERVVAEAVRDGATILTGGHRPDGRGWFYPATVLTDVVPHMTVMSEEVFGPVAPIFAVKSAEAAIAIANASPYGLGASVWSRDTDRAVHIAERLESGQVAINAMVVSDPRRPFGGVKRSGYGRELGAWGVREFVNIQTIRVLENRS